MILWNAFYYVYSSKHPKFSEVSIKLTFKRVCCGSFKSNSKTEVFIAVDKKLTGKHTNDNTRATSSQYYVRTTSK